MHALIKECAPVIEVCLLPQVCCSVLAVESCLLISFCFVLFLGLVSQEAKSSVFVGKGKHVHSNKPKCVTINGQCITNRVVVKSQEFLATGETG